MWISRALPPSKLIDGKAAAARLHTRLAHRVDKLRDLYGVTPALALIRVGTDAVSAICCNSQTRACAATGVRPISVLLPKTVTTSELVDAVGRFNSDADVHGIVVGLPLPGTIDPTRVLESISLEKDVDGHHFYDAGSLVVDDRVFPPCTPYAVLRLLESEGVTIKGENVVVVGANNVVSKPMGLMLLQKGASVSICNANTRELAQYTIMADILIVAAGRPRLIVPSMVKAGAVVIDAGINYLPDGTITGDVEYNGVSAKASRITPVPGGVGPMTVGMMLENTIVAAERSSAGARSITDG
jgi:methylenetetrahydrofolate dehydrogenase (NADP+)/methenyltetrahydrofolate cyclohydrolase